MTAFGPKQTLVVRITKLIRVLLITPLFLWATAAYSESVVDIKFVDSSGSEFRTVTLDQDIERQYGFKPSNPKVLLIETSSLSSSEFNKQDKVLNELGHKAEGLEVLFVVACPADQFRDGYHTSVETANALSDHTLVFRIRLLSRTGTILESSLYPISLSELKKWLASD